MGGNYGKRVCGVGINDCPGICKDKRTLEYRKYNVWRNMIARVYSETYHKTRPSYRGCSVCNRWLKLSNFLEDMVYIPNYVDWEKNPGKYSLDKDILVNGNKTYGPGLVGFVTVEENSSESINRNGLNVSKKIKAVSLTTGEVRFYQSSMDVIRDGFNQSCVSSCCRGKQKKHKGWKFEYTGGDEDVST